MISTEAQSATHASLLASQLAETCFDFYVSNSYCEGVERTDYTDHIVGANATTDPKGWGVKNMTVRTDKTGWTDPKTGEKDAVVYGVTTDYYRACKDEASILKQTLTGLPAGKYVLSMTAMGSNNLVINVFFNNLPIGEVKTSGTSGGGKYGAGSNDYLIPFTKSSDADMPLQLQCKPTANYQEWYIDNFRLYRLPDSTPELEKCATPTIVFEGGYAVPIEHILPRYQKDAPVKVCVRPEELVISNTDEGIGAKIDDSVFLGLNTHYFVTTDAGIKAEIVQESQIDSIIPKGEHVRLTVKREKINVMTEDGNANILNGVQNDLEQKAV